MLTIVQAPHTVLGSPAKPIAKIDQEIKKLIAEMTDTLLHATDPEGVGLAAPQVAKGVQLFIVKESPDDQLMVFINPKVSIPKGVKLAIEEDSKGEEKKEVKLEGCLSLQDIWGIVHRYPKVHVEYLDENGKEHKNIFEGFLATIIQHEYDHLQGVLFPKRVLEQKGQLYKSVKNKKGEIEFEELAL